MVGGPKATYGCGRDRRSCHGGAMPIRMYDAENRQQTTVVVGDNHIRAGRLGST